MSAFSDDDWLRAEVHEQSQLVMRMLYEWARAIRDAKTSWRTWRAPGENPRVYAVYVDERDKVWFSEWSGNAMYRFDPVSEKFERFGFTRGDTAIRQILGRPGEVWLPESGTEHISVIRTA